MCNMYEFCKANWILPNLQTAENLFRPILQSLTCHICLPYGINACPFQCAAYVGMCIEEVMN